MTPSRAASDARSDRLRPAWRILALAALLALAGCRGSLALVVGVATLEPADLRQRLQSGSRATLVDVRDPSEYARGHVPGARSVPMAALDAFFASPEASEPLVLVCEHGDLAARAAAVAHGHGLLDTAVLAGGMTAWNARGLPLELGAAPARPTSIPRRGLGWTAQLLLVVAAFGVKPLYMLLAAVLAFTLRRSREPDLRMLLLALLSFEAGELLCLLDYLLASGGSDLMEIGHMAGMVGMSALLPWSLFLLLDRRVLHLTDPRSPCLGQRFCGRCWKRDGGSCGVRQLLLATIPALVAISAVSLCLPLTSGSVLVSVFGTDVRYGSTLAAELVQFRLFPAAGIALLLVGLAVLLRGEAHVRRAHLPLFLGLGFSLFSLMRFTLLRSFSGALPWADTWEELTELLTVLAVGALLWIFRRPLGLAAAPGGRSPPPTSSEA